LCSLLERLCKEFEPAARGKGLAIVLECPQGSLIATDQSLIERVLRNLLDNAIKYTDSGRVAIRVAGDGDDLVVEIADSGRGIPEAEQAHVFEEFYQVDNQERDRTRGLGLGLAIVRRLTDLLRVRMDMRSSPGSGTTFSLTLPAARIGTPTTEPKQAQSKPVAVHVLVVDDEALIRLGMKTLLEGMGCRATLAGGTEQAVAAARIHKPDIVLSDLRLRGEDNGIRTVCAIRDLYPRLPAILISGDIAPDRLREAEEAGIPLLHKPVPVEALKEAIAKARA
jgi:CheY-like chemotaxis protein/anti-sigma regulatory factor (Ser/Thr protein kinase)